MAVSLRKIVIAAALAMVSGPTLAAELLMVEQPGCAYCRQWNAKNAAIYPLTPEGQFAPLRHVEKSAIASAGVVLERPVVFTPTFLLVDDGRELARIEGYPPDDFFWSLLERLLVAKLGYQPAEHASG